MSKSDTASVEIRDQIKDLMKPKTSVPVAAAMMEEDGAVDAGDETRPPGCAKNCEGLELGNGGGKFGAPVFPTIKQESGMPLFFCCPNKFKPLALYTLWSSTTAYEVRRSLVLCAF